jgi:rhodanese-related sulfurtransferase
LRRRSIRVGAAAAAERNESTMHHAPTSTAISCTPNTVPVALKARWLQALKELLMARVVKEHFATRSEAEAISMQELLERARSGGVVVLDTRPAEEYAAGHVAGAISVPFDQVEARLRELPKSQVYVAYCRGPYCVYADRAMELLRAHGRKAWRLSAGFPEWKLAGLPIQSGLEPGALK